MYSICVLILLLCSFDLKLKIPIQTTGSNTYYNNCEKKYMLQAFLINPIIVTVIF